MTTIGLVSAGVLTFPQGLALVFGANVGTTGTGWLVALIGVRVSLTAAALPMIFVGALIKLLGRGRVSAAGAALAGFALVLFGLTTLQQGMGGLAEQLHPADLPAVLGTTWWSGLYGVLALVAVGLVMTAVMQSSTAALAVTLSAYYAGAVGLDQACALIIGQNIGTATSSAHGSSRCEQHRQAIGPRVHIVQADRGLDRLDTLPCHDTSAGPRFEHHRWRDAACRLSHGLQRRGRFGAATGHRRVHAICRAYSAGTRLAAYAVPRPGGASHAGCDCGSGSTDGCART